MLIRKCDMCGRIDEEFDIDKTCCDQCEQLKLDVRAEAFFEIKKEFDSHVAAQKTILHFLAYVRDDRREEFVELFGEQGSKLLDQALSEVWGS